MNIIGIDLGTNITAITTLPDTSGRHAEVVKLDLSAKKLTPDQRFQAQCDFLDAALDDVLIDETVVAYGPHGKCEVLVGAEYPFNIQGNSRVLAELYAIVRLRCLRAGIELVKIPQTSLKLFATGSGRAEKSDMRMRLFKEFGLDWSEDEADSFWVARMSAATKIPAMCNDALSGSPLKFRQEAVAKLVAGPKRKTAKKKAKD